MYKVLLVDDEPYVIEGLKTMGDWGKYGFVICGEATNGEDALELINVCGPDLVFTDIRMPAMDGLQLIKQARERLGSKGKFVILSGYDDFAYIQYAMRYDVNDYLLKPIDDQELNVILADIARRIGEENQEQQHLHYRLAPTVENAVKRILKGDIKESSLNQIKSIWKIDDGETIRCILIEADRYADWLDELKESEINRKKDEIKAVIRANLPDQSDLSLLELDVHRFCLIISENMKFYNHLGECLSMAQEVLKARGCSVSIAVSEELPGLEFVEQLYKQAALALDYKFFKGEGNLTYYSDIKNISLNCDFHNIRVELLLEDIRHNDREGIVNQIGHLFENFSLQMCTLEVIKTFIKNFQLEATKQVLDMDGNTDEIVARFIKFDKMMNYTTITKLQKDLNAFCGNLADYFSTAESGSKDIIYKIKIYIKENYHKEINLQRIAREFYMNPAYLGQLFKKHTGMQCGDFLHQTRIEEAKKLLRKTDMKITEIARTIGYRDPDYFVSKFKAITRVSPSVYKKELAKRVDLDMKAQFGLFNKINDIPLKYKFILIYVMCVLIPLVTVNLVFLSKISVFVKEREAENSRIALERARTDFVGIIQGCVAVNHSIATDKLLSKALDWNYADFNEYYDSYNSYLRDRLDRYVSIYNCISEIRLYTTNSTVFGSGYYIYIDDEVKNKEWYEPLTKSGNMIALHAYKENIPSIITSSDQYLCVIRKMNEYSYPGAVQNYIKVNIDINKVFEIFNREQDYISICLVDEKNRMIYAPNNQVFYNSAPKNPKYNPAIYGKNAIVLEYKLGNANYFNGWKIVGVADGRTVSKALSQSRYFIFCLALVSMLIATLLIWVIVRSYNDRIRELSKQMIKVKNQQFELIEMAEGKDEIGGLIKSFNLMTAKINALINDVYKLNLQKKELELERVRAELNFLQSQMNPHFLFNTLNAILVVCVKNNYSEISEVIKYLSKTLRRLFSWKDDLVTIEEELDFSEMYLKIEKFRFGDKFQYKLAIDDKSLLYKIPKLSIQPLIENACKHGIQTIKGVGLLRVKVAVVEDTLYVSVKDNGSGIDGDKLNEIMLAMTNETESSNGIGIRNVYRRLKLYYGEEVKFSISSRVNEGTEVSFVVPIKKLDDIREGGGFDSLCTGSY